MKAMATGLQYLAQINRALGQNHLPFTTLIPSGQSIVVSWRNHTPNHSRKHDQKPPEKWQNKKGGLMTILEDICG